MIVSFDLDSTLADTQHRARLINQENRLLTDWDAYSLACRDDQPGPALPLAYAFQSLGARLVVVSARSECARGFTVDWLYRHSVYPEHVVLYDEKIFGNGLRRREITHIELKVRQLAHLTQVLREKITLHVDDWPEIRTEVVQRLHIPTVIVKPNYELAAAATGERVV